MPDIIQLLPDSIANQIAAGEVVQRPASAVKELMENAVDANATEIKLIVKEAGKTHIQIIDNGSGMSETDARLSLERHATSKIRSAEDLFRIKTMGFRGEALASLAAVSQLEMKTRQSSTELGTLLQVEGSDVKMQEPAACAKGTSITVKNLFYNIPGRRNFLKSNPVELRHIYDEFYRIALSHPEIAFSFIQGDELVYELGSSKLSQRIVALFGKSYQEQLASCQEEISGIQVTGYVGRPEAARKTRGEQFIFVNKRFIKSNYLNHAIMNAFEGLLQESSFPFYVLFIDIDPKHVDVNVHPTKTEIKFDDERAVYAVVRAAVRQALGTHSLTPAIDFNADVNLIQKAQHGFNLSKDIYFDEQLSSGIARSNLDNWEKLFETDHDSQLFKKLDPNNLVTMRFESTLNKNSDESAFVEQPILQLHNKFLVRLIRDGIMIIDQQAGHQRVLYEKFLKNFKGSAGHSQQSLFPSTVDLSPGDFALVIEMKNELFTLGFQFEEFGNHTLLVTGLPVDSKINKEVLEELIEQFKQNKAELDIPVHENLARSLAVRASIKSGQMLSAEERSTLLEGLFSCSNPNYSPNGNPTFYIFEASKIEKIFGGI